MSRKRPSFMVNDLLKETGTTLIHWQHNDLINCQTRKKISLNDTSNDHDDNDDDDDDDDDTSNENEDIDNYLKISNNKTNLINRQYQWYPTNLFNVYTNDWDKCLFDVKHMIPVNKEDSMNLRLMNVNNNRDNNTNSIYLTSPSLTTTMTTPSRTTSVTTTSTTTTTVNSHHKTDGNEVIFYHQNINRKLMKKSRKARTAFTDYQLTELEHSFDRQKYLPVQDRMELATKLSLSDRQVKTWYQNRRTKWKRQTAVGLELITEAENYVAIQRLIDQSPFWAYHPTVRYLLSNLDLMHKSSPITPIISSATSSKSISVGLSSNNHVGNLSVLRTPVSTTSETNKFIGTTYLNVDNNQQQQHHHQHHPYKQHFQYSHSDNKYFKDEYTLSTTINPILRGNDNSTTSSIILIPTLNNNLSIHSKSINLEQSIDKNQSLYNQYEHRISEKKTFNIHDLWSLTTITTTITITTTTAPSSISSLSSTSSLNQTLRTDYTQLSITSSSKSPTTSLSSVCGILNALIEGT